MAIHMVRMDADNKSSMSEMQSLLTGMQQMSTGLTSKFGDIEAESFKVRHNFQQIEKAHQESVKNFEEIRALFSDIKSRFGDIGSFGGTVVDRFQSADQSMIHLTQKISELETRFMANEAGLQEVSNQARAATLQATYAAGGTGSERAGRG